MRKTIRNYGLAVLLCCLCVLLTACGRKYTVTFDLNGGTLLSGELVQTVEEGQSAAAPQAELGPEFLGHHWRHSRYGQVDPDPL